MADAGRHILSTRPRLQTFPEELAASALAGSLQPFHFLIRVPALLFLATLSVFVFRPPDLELHHIDRVAFVVLLTSPSALGRPDLELISGEDCGAIHAFPPGPACLLR